MPVSRRRPPMPRLPPFAMANALPPRHRPHYLFVFFLLFTVPLICFHIPLLTLPFFWDELGQFVPTALDLLRGGSWIAHSTLPNIHPPGVEAYLVIWYELFGYSIAVTRVAMLMLAGAGLLIAFLLAIELSEDAEGAPAFLPPILLLASPLFFMQSMMAQLDMPAMVFTLLALLLFVRKRYAEAAFACVVLAMTKETGLGTALSFFVILSWRRDYKRAAYFVTPVVAFAAWMIFLHAVTHNWMGNQGFAHYNLTYPLHPVRIVISFARRFYYLFFAEFRWFGTIVLVLASTKAKLFRSERWRITLIVAAANIVIVSVLGGAELERYLLPVLPIFYIAVSVALSFATRWIALPATALLVAGLIVSLFWNPPYPFPYENNLAMVDFVRLQQAAANYAERFLRDRTIATAWPYTGSFEHPDYGFVQHEMKVVETDDFHLSSIQAVSPASFDALIVYTRTWAPMDGMIGIPAVRRFLARFYEWEPDITQKQCLDLGLVPVMHWRGRGQEATVYVRESPGQAQSAD